MSIQLETGPVVVGVDGTASAARAVRWAAGLAGRRGVELRLAHAFDLPGRTSGEQTGDVHIRELLRGSGKRWLAAARALALETAPGLDVQVLGIDGDAVDLLVEQSATASLLVLGTRGLGGVTGVLVGSTAVAVAGRARCPVVVACGSDEPPAGGPVVVGVAAGHTSDEAVAFAFGFAATNGADLVAVHSGPGAVPASVADVVDRWQAKYPDVRVTIATGVGRPADALLAQARDARLVVVGTRGRGTIRGLLLGSTSQHLLHHSPCPVAVVRSELG